MVTMKSRLALTTDYLFNHVNQEEYWVLGDDAIIKRSCILCEYNHNTWNMVFKR